MEETVEITNEKATKAKIPDSEIPGIKNQYELNPLKIKSAKWNPGTTNVTRYKVMAYVTHLKRPKVIKFIGRRRMFIIGLTIKVANIRTNPARKSVYMPSVKIIPETT
jgi:hypothetical protein